MLGTHSVKTLNSALKQEAICAEIIAQVPNYLICSQTINARQKYWALPQSAANIKPFRDISKTATTAPIVIPDLTDGHLDRRIGGLENRYFSLLSSCAVKLCRSRRGYKALTDKPLFRGCSKKSPDDSGLFHIRTFNHSTVSLPFGQVIALLICYFCHSSIFNRALSE